MPAGPVVLDRLFDNVPSVKWLSLRQAHFGQVEQAVQRVVAGRDGE